MSANIVGAIQATPFVTDLDGDAKLDAYVATSLGEVHRFEAELASPLPYSLAIGWGSATGNSEDNSGGHAEDAFAPAPTLATPQQVVQTVIGEEFVLPLTRLDDTNFDDVIDAADVIRAGR